MEITRFIMEKPKYFVKRKGWMRYIRSGDGVDVVFQSLT